MQAAILERPRLDNLVVRAVPTPQPRARRGASAPSRGRAEFFRDTLVVSSGYGSNQKTDNLIPLSDGAGEVAAVGPDVVGLRIGDRVLGCFFPTWAGGAPNAGHFAGSLGGTLNGVASEYRVFRADAVLKTPVHLSDVEASTLPCAALTAWSARGKRC